MYAMGTSTPKSELDRTYRGLVTKFLEEVQARHDLNKTELGDALGKDRASASRYLSGAVRAPLQVLQFLYQTVREPVPHEIDAAWWALQRAPKKASRKAA